MTDHLDIRPPMPVVDAIHDPVVTPVGAVPAFQLEPERSTDPVWFSGRRTIDELDRSSRNLLWKTLQGSPCGTFAPNGGLWEGLRSLDPATRPRRVDRLADGWFDERSLTSVLGGCCERVPVL
jgi:hypothetical protein